MSSESENENPQNQENEHVQMNDVKKLSACTRCRLVKNEAQFRSDGCENCGDNPNTVKYFEGLIFMTKPTESWVAKWNKLVSYVPGCYCVRISGENPQSEEDEEDDDD